MVSFPFSGGPETPVRPDDVIITKTDPQGRITYANRTFMRIVGAPESALLGHPHNIIRHPDMPRGAFRLMWKTLAGGNEFFAAVKNCTASGGFYWVFANITPDYDASGKLQGYFSVRRHLRQEARAAIEPVYARMRAIEQEAGKQAGPDKSVEWLASELAKQGVSYERFVLEIAGYGLEGGK